MKRASNRFEKIYEDIIFDYFNITLFIHISVYYMYYYTYLYLYILSIYTIYITIKTFLSVTIQKLHNRLNIYNNAFRRIFKLVGYNTLLSPVIATFITQPKACYQRIKTVRFSKLIKGNKTC